MGLNTVTNQAPKLNKKIIVYIILFHIQFVELSKWNNFSSVYEIYVFNRIYVFCIEYSLCTHIQYTWITSTLWIVISFFVAVGRVFMVSLQLIAQLNREKKRNCLRIYIHIMVFGVYLIYYKKQIRQNI